MALGAHGEAKQGGARSLGEQSRMTHAGDREARGRQGHVGLTLYCS